MMLKTSGESCRKIVPGIYNFPRSKFSTKQSPITSHSYIDDDFLSLNKEEIASHVQDLGPYPSYSNILNQHHFYQNEVLMKYLRKDPHPVSLRQLAGFGKKLSKQKIVHRV